MNINLAMPLAPILIFQHFGHDNVRADKTAQRIGKTLLGVALFRKVFDGCQRNRKIIKETNKKNERENQQSAQVANQKDVQCAKKRNKTQTQKGCETEVERR